MAHKPSNALLRRLVSALIEEWGAESVMREIAACRHPDSDRFHDERTKASARRRPSALELLELYHLPANRREPIQKLAERFDQGKFLPDSSQVREFMHYVGKRPVSSSRADSFRAVLPILREMPLDRIDEILRNELFHGPASLGPLSEAISRAAAGRQGRAVSETDDN